MSNPLSININYFQGPRYHIALQMVWRKKVPGPNQLEKSALCGSGIDHAKFSSLEGEGWEIVPAEVFNLPTGVVNTCVERDEMISTFSFEIEIGDDEAIEGAIQNVTAKITNVASGEQVELDASEFVLSAGELSGNKVIYDMTLKNPIMRDSDKEIQIDFERRK